MKRKYPSKKTKRPSNLMIIGFIFAALVTIFLSWNQYTHFQDKQKFMTLKQDMLALQAEFNKIDPGWTYSEGCHAKGEKFKENEASSCGISLSISKNIEISKYKDLVSSVGKFEIKREYDFEDYGRKDHNLSINYSLNSSVACSFGLSLQLERQSSGFGCHDSALEFYFPKTQ